MRTKLFKVAMVLLMILCVVALVLTFTGCTQADKVSTNLSKEADNFNVVRQLTVINCMTNDVVFQMTGKMSIQPDPEQNQLEVTVEDEYGDYQKHFIGMSQVTMYTCEQLRAKDVSNYRYTINFNPDMWMPVDVKTID